MKMKNLSKLKFVYTIYESRNDHGVMVNSIRKGHGRPSWNPRQGSLHFI